MVNKISNGLLLFLLLIGNEATAQKKVSVGVGASVSAKTNYLIHNPTPVSPFFKVGLVGILHISGTRETNLGMNLNLGAEVDKVKYEAYRFGSDFGYIKIDRYWFVLNPELIFPTSLQQLKLSIGIGINYLVSSVPTVGQGGNGNSSTNIYDYTVNFSTLDSITTAGSNAIIPLITAGAIYQLNGHTSIKISLCQHLLDNFNKKTSVPYKLSLEDKSLNINYTPLYLTVGFEYLF